MSQCTSIQHNNKGKKHALEILMSKFAIRNLKIHKSFNSSPLYWFINYKTVAGMSKYLPTQKR
jgi:hypothetical protein